MEASAPVSFDYATFPPSRTEKRGNQGSYWPAGPCP